MRRNGILALALLLAAAAAAGQPPIRQARGVDPQVDYRSLIRYGPWDDRNYQLTAEDLALLPEWEAELVEPLPAFYRVAMRRAVPELARQKLPYPRSALNVFLQQFGGYLVEGRLYTKVERVGGRLQVVLEDGAPAPLGREGEGAATEDAGPSRALDGEVRVTSPVGAAESAVAISPADPDLVIAGSNGPGGGQKMHYSSDGGESWTQAADLPLGGTCCDPTVDWSSDGSFAYTATLGNCLVICDVWFYRSSDNGQNWNDLETVTPGDPRRELSVPGDVRSDKEYLHVDRSASSPHKDNIYATWHRFNVMKSRRSTDFGNTWDPELDVSGAGELGIGSDIVTDAAGNVYYFWPSFGASYPTPGVGDRILVARSTDGGVSFGAATQIEATEGEFIFPIPSMDVRQVFIYTAAAVDLSQGPAGDRLYVAWTDSTGPTTTVPANNHARIQVAYSDDGAAWTVVTPHETDDMNEVDRWHPWIAVGADGIVHLAFYDTRRDPTRTSVDFFYTRSLDRGESWLPPRRLTGAQSPSPGPADTFEFGDYNGLDVLMSDMVAVFTDNRDETGGGFDSKDIYAAGILECAAMDELVLTAGPPVSGPEEKVACNTITAGTDYFVQGPSGELTLRAGRHVQLIDGFMVQDGGQLTVEIDPYLATAP